MKERRHQPDFVLLMSLLLLVSIGIVMVYSASSVYALSNNQPVWYYFVRQAVYGLIGLAAMIFLMNVRFTSLKKRAGLCLGLSLASLTLVLVPGIGHEALGGRRWFSFHGQTLQPSEISIILLTIYLAYILNKKAAQFDNFKRGVLPILVVVGIVFALIAKEPDLGTGLVFLCTAFCMIFASGMPLRHIGKILGISIPSILALAMLSGHERDRIVAFFSAHSGAGSLGWQIQNSLFAINAGGWFGRGLGQSIEKFLWLPEAHTDFIFAIITEETGLIGATVVILLFVLVVWRGLLIALSVEDRFGGLLAVGITSMIGVGVAINLFAVTGLAPVTGIPLPFISYGGTALILKMGAMGILLNVSRYTPVRPDKQEPALPTGVTPITSAR